MNTRQHTVWFRVLLWTLLIAAMLASVGYIYIAYAMASGVTTSNRSAIEERPEDYDLPYEDVTFSPRGSEWSDIVLRGWLIEREPAGLEEGPTALLVHGLNSNRASDKALGLARRLYDLGYNSLLFDLRGHGESDGDQLAAGYFERWDVLGAYDFLTRRGAPSDRIGVVGWSMGGATALLAVSEEPAIGAAVTDSAFADARDMIAQETARATPFPEWLVPMFIPGMMFMANALYGIEVSAVVPEESAASLGFPILIIHGDADSRIPVGHSARIFTAAPVGSQLWVIPDSDHADGFADSPDEYVERVYSYFQSRLADDQPGSVEVMAPIYSVKINIAESFPPQYFVKVDSGLPAGCSEFYHQDESRSGNTVTITITNLSPAPVQQMPCAAVHGTHDFVIPLGTEFQSGETYTVHVNDTTETFEAQ